jgi:hypothetical protein
MTNTVLIRSGTRHIDQLRPNRTMTSRSPYLSGLAVGVTSTSTAAREQVRLAQQELKAWEGAYDRNSTGHPDKYCAEIRVAEERLRAVLLSS